MLDTALLGNPADADVLADWPGWLEADGLLSPGLRESYRRTLEGFEQFCRKRAQGQGTPDTPAAAARVSVELAREYMELQRLERAPGPAQLQESGRTPSTGCSVAGATNSGPCSRACRLWAGRTRVKLPGNAAW